MKLDCQGLVARLVKDFALLTAAVEVSGRWRELAEKLSKVSRKQMDAYEAPYREVDGVIESEVWGRNTDEDTHLNEINGKLMYSSFIFSKHFLLVQVTVNLDRIPGTLLARQNSD